jgi:hypothetical protein
LHVHRSVIKSGQVELQSQNKINYIEAISPVPKNNGKTIVLMHGLGSGLGFFFGNYFI